jgi:TATA-box binding protein (TBP) (component of TFIID and TFIIIB)
MQPGTPVELQLHPPEGKPVQVSAVVWRVDPDSMALLFLKSIQVQATGSKSWQETGRRGWR